MLNKMTTLNKYKIYCNTDNKWEYIWLDSSNTYPTKCPTNTAHNVDLSSIAIIDEVSTNHVVVKEESIPTGGNFAATTIKVNATANTTSYSEISWPFPVTALSSEWVTKAEHEGDITSMSVGQDTVIGALAGVISTSSVWSAQNYVAGDVVTYDGRVYTCVLDTINNEVPTNLTYWKHGHEIPVSSTVIDHTAIGFYLNLDDGINNNTLDRVISTDKVSSKVYVETSPTDTFSPVTPTYIKQTVYVVKDYEIGPAWEHIIGESKIGGSYVPANTKVRVKYENKHPTQDKILIGRVEYLY